MPELREEAIAKDLVAITTELKYIGCYDNKIQF